MSPLARQVLGASRKRREREAPDCGGFRAPPPVKPRDEAVKPAPNPSLLSWPEPPALQGKNRLLAGYLAHEFLTKGTLLGQPFDPARAEKQREPQPKPVYAELAHLLKFDGTHIPGVVNPTQLACWIQKGKF